MLKIPQSVTLARGFRWRACMARTCGAQSISMAQPIMKNKIRVVASNFVNNSLFLRMQ